MKQGVRRTAAEVLGDISVWRLRQENWEAVERGLRAVRSALAQDDEDALLRAVANVEMAGPHRIIGLQDSTALPVTEEVRERVNELVHRLDTEEPEGAGPGGHASAGA